MQDRGEGLGRAQQYPVRPWPPRPLSRRPRSLLPNGCRRVLPRLTWSNSSSATSIRSSAGQPSTAKEAIAATAHAAATAVAPPWVTRVSRVTTSRRRSSLGGRDRPSGGQNPHQRAVGVPAAGMDLPGSLVAGDGGAGGRPGATHIWQVFCELPEELPFAGLTSGGHQMAGHEQHLSGVVGSHAPRPSVTRRYRGYLIMIDVAGWSSFPGHPESVPGRERDQAGPDPGGGRDVLGGEQPVQHPVPAGSRSPSVPGRRGSPPRRSGPARRRCGRGRAARRPRRRGCRGGGILPAPARSSWAASSSRRSAIRISASVWVIFARSRCSPRSPAACAASSRARSASWSIPGPR